jgi:hypothetical protein
MDLTLKKPVMAGDPPKLMCLVTQGELFGMRGQLDGCIAVLHQIAALQEQSMAPIALTDGAQAVVPTQCAMAMTALSHLFGVGFYSTPAAEGTPDGTETAPPAAEVAPPQPEPTEPPPRTAWRPTVVQGGKS